MFLAVFMSLLLAAHSAPVKAEVWPKEGVTFDFTPVADYCKAQSMNIVPAENVFGCQQMLELSQAYSLLAVAHEEDLRNLLEQKGLLIQDAYQNTIKEHFDFLCDERVISAYDSNGAAFWTCMSNMMAHNAKTYDISVTTKLLAHSAQWYVLGIASFCQICRKDPARSFFALGRTLPMTLSAGTFSKSALLEGVELATYWLKQRGCYTEEFAVMFGELIKNLA